MRLYFKIHKPYEIYDENNNIKYKFNFNLFRNEIFIFNNDNNKILTLKREKNIFRFISNDKDIKEIKIKTKGVIIQKIMSSDESIIVIPNQKWGQGGEYDFFCDNQNLGTIINRLNLYIDISEPYYNKETELFFICVLSLIIKREKENNFLFWCIWIFIIFNGAMQGFKNL